MESPEIICILNQSTNQSSFIRVTCPLYIIYNIILNTKDYVHIMVPSHDMAYKSLSTKKKNVL